LNYSVNSLAVSLGYSLGQVPLSMREVEFIYEKEGDEKDDDREREEED